MLEKVNSQHSVVQVSLSIAYQSPCVGRELLTLRLEAGVGVPELSAQEKTAVRLDTATVGNTGVCLSRARKNCIGLWCLDCTGMVQVALTRVEHSLCARSERGRDEGFGVLHYDLVQRR